MVYYVSHLYDLSSPTQQIFYHKFFSGKQKQEIKFACNNNVIYDHESSVYDVLLYRHYCTNSARNVTKRYLKKMA